MPSIAITRPYEAVYIVDPDLGEEQITAITDRYKQVVETGGGTVEKVDVWERRRLAYEVKGRSEGIYVVMHFTGTPSVEAELRRIFLISEDQIRSLIVKQEDSEEALPPAQASSAPAAAAAPAPAAAAEAPVAPAVTEEAPAPAAVATEDAPALAPEQVSAE